MAEDRDPFKQVLVTLQRRADSKRQPAEYSWEALNHILQNVQGNSVDYDAFKAQYDADPTLKDFIDNFDADGITLKTNRSSTEQPVADKGTSDINTSAKRAAAKQLG